ncbi:MAG TPA: hypothetical protein VHM24_12680, partial [Gemmatimonadaceae bacterium]|nr:hypothetical protein [Gemmatimonadaceae bacterium]
MTNSSAIAARPRHPPAHRVEFALARTLEKTVSTLPEAAADALGRHLGRVIHRIGIRRPLVEENLRNAYPDKDEAWIARTATAAYEHLGREAAAIMRLSKLDPSSVVERTNATGWNDLQEALALG